MSSHLQNDDKRLLELLERWQSGDFSRADEQELLSLTASDEFRREAVEGFLSMPEADHASRLAALRSRLRTQHGGARRVAWPQIMAAAAAMALLVSAAIWLIPAQKEMAPIAQQAPPPPVDSAPEQSMQAQEITTTTDRRTPTAAPETANESFSSTAAPASDAAGASAPADPEKKSDDESPAAPAVGKAVEYAKAEDALEEVDTRPGNMAPPLREESDKAMARSKTMETAKKKSAPAKQSASVSEPKDGWDAFRRYLRRNARLPEAARQQNISGNVSLQFMLDDNNQPADFQVLRSLGYGCDEEAIRLVKSYPWQRNDTLPVRVDIPFVR